MGLWLVFGTVGVDDVLGDGVLETVHELREVHAVAQGRRRGLGCCSLWMYCLHGVFSGWFRVFHGFMSWNSPVSRFSAVMVI